MPKKDDDNPMEEIQKQLRDLLKNKNLQVAFAPFMQSMNEAEKSEEPVSSDDSKPENKRTRSRQRMPSKLSVLLTVSLRKFVTTWTVL